MIAGRRRCALLLVTAAAPVLMGASCSPLPPATSFGDGTWEVGVDIAPGPYSTQGDATDCYWTRRTANADGTPGELLGDNALNPGPQTITVQLGQVISSQWCSTWTKR